MRWPTSTERRRRRRGSNHRRLLRPNVGLVTQDRPFDRWQNRDLPVLISAARRLDAGEIGVDAGGDASEFPAELRQQTGLG